MSHWRERFEPFGRIVYWRHFVAPFFDAVVISVGALRTGNRGNTRHENILTLILMAGQVVNVWATASRCDA